MSQPRRFDHIALGRRGEELVARWYLQRGCTVVARNWRCAAGELDIVVRCAETLVFCEVKARSSERFGSPFEAVDHRRRQRLRNAAGQFLASSGQRARQIRFDVAAVVGPRVEVIHGAF